MGLGSTHCFWAISLDSANLLSKKRSMACWPSSKPCSSEISSPSTDSCFLDFDLFNLNDRGDFLHVVLLFTVTASSSSTTISSRASSKTCKKCKLQERMISDKLTFIQKCPDRHQTSPLELILAQHWPCPLLWPLTPDEPKWNFDSFQAIAEAVARLAWPSLTWLPSHALHHRRIRRIKIIIIICITVCSIPKAVFSIKD